MRESREIKMTGPIGRIKRHVHFSERGGSSGPRVERNKVHDVEVQCWRVERFKKEREIV